MASLHRSFDEVFEKARLQRTLLPSLPERLKKITALKKIILEKKEFIIDQIVKETKKSRSDALMSEIFPALDHLTFLEKNGLKLLSPEKVKTPISLMGKSSEIFYDSLGVVLVISPWNYPFYQAITPCSSAYLCGNATLYKPSEHTPLTGLLEDLFQEAEIEAIEIVYGDGKTAASLIDLKPAKIFFTGSVKTGKLIMAQAAVHLIPVELELGGKDPMIVFGDANLNRAAKGAVWGAFTNCGQSCTSVETLYIEESVAEEFKRLVCEEIMSIEQATDADLGFMTTEFQSRTVLEHLSDAKTRGARVLNPAHKTNADLNRIAPTVLDKVTPEMLVVREETFGPILPIMTFRNEKEVIDLVNRSSYGLSASVWTANQDRARRVAHALETGNVSINNVMLTEANHYLPFGGVKSSGFGRSKGEAGLRGFTNIKSVLFDKNSSKVEANWYPYTPEKYKLFSQMMNGLFSGTAFGFAQFLLNGLKLEGYSQKAKRLGKSNPSLQNTPYQKEV